MIKHPNEYRVDVRRKMRGGAGSVKIEHFWEPETEMLGSNRMFARLTLEPGSSIGFHRHENEEEILVIVNGVAEADDNGQIATLHAGDTIITGNSAGHGIKNVGQEALELIAVIATYPEAK